MPTPNTTGMSVENMATCVFDGHIEGARIDNTIAL